MALANSLRKVASKAISRFGGTVSVTFVTAGAYDTSSGTITTSSSSETVKGVLEDVNQRDVNELVRAGDKRLTVAAQDLTEVTFGTNSGFRVLGDGAGVPAYSGGQIYFDAVETVVTGKHAI